MQAEVYNDYRAHLTTITKGLREMAAAAGRGNVADNQLLRECYNLVDDELHTMEGWQDKEYRVRTGQHPYLFWGEPIKANGKMFSQIMFLYAREQVIKAGDYDSAMNDISMIDEVALDEPQKHEGARGKQYDDIKAQYPDTMLLFRCGDFYECYYEDAIKASEILGISLTHRDNKGTTCHMAGFPFHALDIYLPKLVRAGLRVAICDDIKKGGTK